jgi:hypothetical protein
MCLQLRTLLLKETEKYSVARVREETIHDRATAAYRQSQCQLLRIEGCRVVSAADPYGRILRFLDRSRYFFFQVAPQLYSRS